MFGFCTEECGVAMAKDIANLKRQNAELEHQLRVTLLEAHRYAMANGGCGASLDARCWACAKAGRRLT